MSGIRTESAPLDVGEGEQPGAVPLTVCEPERVNRGGIVLLHEARDFPQPLLELMEAMAEEGWAVVAPNLFHRARAAETDAEVFGEDLFADFDAACGWLSGRGVQPDRIGVLGFDDAGTAAVVVATSRPVGATVSVAAHGIVRPLRESVPPLVEAVRALQAPWLALYGEDDPATPPEEVEQLGDAAGRADVAAHVVSYRGGEHRVDEAFHDARQRIFDWFDANLR